MSANAKPSCASLFNEPNSKLLDQLFTTLELNYQNQSATRNYSFLSILKVRRDLNAHSFIKNEIHLPDAFIVPKATKLSMLKVSFKILPDAKPLTDYIHLAEVKSKFDLALNLVIKQINELGYPWGLKLGRYYISSNSIPKVDYLSHSQAKREIYYNNNIVLFVSNTETKVNHQIHLTLDSFLYSPSTGQFIFSVHY